MVKHSLHAAKCGRCLHIILAGELGEEQARVIELRRRDSPDELVEEEGDDAVTGKLYIDHIAGTVDFIP